MHNERAAIMALTFGIGLTTGLIAYGLPTDDVPLAYEPAVNVASTRQALQNRPAASPVVTPATTNPQRVDSYVESDTQGLYHVVRGERTLVSPTVSAAGNIKEAHLAVHAATPSADAAFVFFCAETVDSAGKCFPRVFSTATFTTHTVAIAGGVNALNPAELNATWTADGRLQLNQLRSVSTEEPWLVR